MVNHYQGAALRNLVKGLDGGPYYTTVEVAKALKRHPDTIWRWRQRADAPQPSKVYEQGDGMTYLYTQDDIAALKAWSKTVKAGRPRKEKGE